MCLTADSAPFDVETRQPGEFYYDAADECMDGPEERRIRRGLRVPRARFPRVLCGNLSAALGGQIVSYMHEYCCAVGTVGDRLLLAQAIG